MMMMMVTHSNTPTNDDDHCDGDQDDDDHNVGNDDGDEGNTFLENFSYPPTSHINIIMAMVVA